MTVKKYLDDLNKTKLEPTSPGQISFADACMESTEIWSNAACKGYLIRAGLSVGLDREQIMQLLQAMSWAFDDISVNQAIEIYERF